MKLLTVECLDSNTTNEVDEASMDFSYAVAAVMKKDENL